MEELLDLYEEMDVAVPVDVLTEAIGTYGFILESNNPQEDE
jgi:hypothetical protein